jgi:hypothetical protein
MNELISKRNSSLFLTGTENQIRPQIYDTKLNEIRQEATHKNIISSTGFTHNGTNQEIKAHLSQQAELYALEKEQRLQEQLEIKDRNIRATEARLKEYQKERTRAQQLKQHRFDKIKDKVTVSEPERGYYDRMPIKPGFLFLDCLLKAPREYISNLSINIPETLYYSDKMYYIYTDPLGRCNCSTDIYFFKFLKTIESYRVSPESKDFTLSDLVPAILRGKTEGEQNMQKLVCDWEIFNIKIMSHELSQYAMMQRYIKFAGGKPAVTRLYYYPQNQSKANYALFINNIVSEATSKRENLASYVVDTSKPETLEIFTKSGSAIKSFEVEASKIVSYLNKGYNIRIQEIILDFLKDDQGVIWLCGCKGFVIDPSTLPKSLLPITEWYEGKQLNGKSEISDTMQEVIEEKRKNLMSFVHCKLCRLYYTNNELGHLVSVRMLMLFKIHISKRKDLPFDTSHLKVTTSDLLSQSVRICQFCYMLVTSEFELIDAEEKLSKICHIPVKDMSFVENPKLAVQRQFLPKVLLQWRMLCHINYMYEFSELVGINDLYILLRFGDQITSFPYRWTAEDQKEPHASIDFMRVHYFFSNPEVPLNKFILDFEIEVRISLGNNWSKPIASTNSQFLREFPKNMSPNCAVKQIKQLTLFRDDHTPVCSMSMIAGLGCDSTVPTKNIKVLLTKYKGILIPEEHYITTDPLPPEWMEIFGVEPEMEETFGKELSDNDFYTPKISVGMEDICSPLRSEETHRKYKIIECKDRKSTLNNLHTNSGTKLNRPPSGIIKRNIQSARVPRSELSNASATPMCSEMDIEQSSAPPEVKGLFATVNEYLSKRPTSARPKLSKDFPRPLSGSSSQTAVKSHSLRLKSPDYRGNSPATISSRRSRNSTTVETNPNSVISTVSSRPNNPKRKALIGEDFLANESKSALANLRVLRKVQSNRISYRPSSHETSSRHRKEIDRISESTGSELDM